MGKGQAGRIFAHVTESQLNPHAEARKNTRIREIETSGRSVEHMFLRIGLETHEQGLVVEQSVIDACKAAGVTLTNIQGGHESSDYGLATAENTIARFAAPPAPSLTDPVVMFIINRAWDPAMSRDDVYRVTRGHWVVGAQTRERATYAFGVAHGIVRGVYRIENWFRFPITGKPDRWGFEGQDAADVEGSHLGTSVRHLIPERGAQNPVRRYLGGIS